MTETIEVLFGDGEAGALLCASEDDERFGEAVPLCLMADVGDIRKPMGSEYRRKLIESLYFQGQWDNEINPDEGFPSPEKMLSDFEKKLSGTKKVRVWLSDCAYSRCGFLHLCTLLENYRGEVQIVRLARKMSVYSDDITEHYSWGESEPGFFIKSLSDSMVISPREISACAEKWRKLQRENSPLRVVLGSEVISAPVNFYDFLIRKYLSQPMKEVVLIGKILSENQIGVGDYWFAKRIEHFIGTGKIRVVKDDPSKYNRVIERIQ